ncbi:hypothetical protein [Hymenobacter sublimis]|uniref:STAS/SEC14 domain-containing protein n=1 Tax=Hymenobacter sublimis TaxID=2933777 RepID=A0ABY4J6M5_9BACT|nr:hypothetical protein [Hymenobacter sublimis]UPL48285.1 hypothetical protein MWH26_13940 [Hymenobacter sublimis]
MQLVAYRPEYRIYLDLLHNHVVYERRAEQTLAQDIPYFLADWQRVLQQLRPGFTMLCDVSRTLGPNVRLLPLYVTLRELLKAAGLAAMAEVHPFSLTMQPLSRALGERLALPVFRFTDRAEAERFLQEHNAPVTSGFVA